MGPRGVGGMLRRPVRLFVPVALVLIVAIAAGPAAAAIPDPRDPGPRDLHPPGAAWSVSGPTMSAAPTTDNFTVLGHLKLPGTSPDADVFFYDHGGEVGKFAYVGTWSGPCSATGVKVIDVNDPANPTLVGLLVPGSSVSTEDIVVRRIGDRDILATGLQVCAKGGIPGVAFYDVTDPAHAKELSFSRTPFGGVHELDMVVRPDGRALALLAVPFSEFGDVYFGTHHGGEFRILDVTDPAHPVKISTWGIIADSDVPGPHGTPIASSYEGLGIFAATFDHSVRAFDDGMTAYVSYWDAGVLKFDISDPANPVVLGRTTYPALSDGDAHSMTLYETGGQRYILQNDEDSDVSQPASVSSSATGSEVFAGLDEPWMPTTLADAGPVDDAVFDGGTGCKTADFDGAAGKIAIVDTVDPYYEGIIDGWSAPCRIGRQLTLAADAGATAVVSNLVSPDDPYPFPYRTPPGLGGGTDMPAVQISANDPLAETVRTALASGEVTMTLTPSTPGFGFLRVYRESAGTDADGDGVAEFSQTGSFSALTNVTGELDAPPGSWEIHNTEVNGDRAYSSWYSNGIVALDLTNPASPALVGQFVPRASARRTSTFGRKRFPIVWGVVLDPSTGIVYASDMRSGLWIVQPTGEAAPGP